MADLSRLARKTPADKPKGFSLTEVLLIAFMLTALFLAGSWLTGQASRDIQFNDGFNERSEEYLNAIGPDDPFIGMISRSLKACGDYSRVAAKLALEKSKQNTEARLQKAGRESFDACVNQHLVELQSTVKDDRMAVLQAGLKCDKGCPMLVIEGFHPWKIDPDARLDHFQGR